MPLQGNTKLPMSGFLIAFVRWQMSALFIANVWILNGDLVLQGEVSKVHCIAPRTMFIIYYPRWTKYYREPNYAFSGFVACHTYIWLHIDDPIFAPRQNLSGNTNALS